MPRDIDFYRLTDRVEQLEHENENLQAKLNLVLDRMDCNWREHNSSKHCRVDNLCLTCEIDHIKQTYIKSNEHA